MTESSIKWQHKQPSHHRREKASDYFGGKWPLNLGTSTDSQRHWKEAKKCDECLHKHRVQAAQRTRSDGFTTR